MSGQLFPLWGLGEAILSPCSSPLIRAAQPQFPLPRGMFPPSQGGFLGPVRLCHLASDPLWDLCPKDPLGLFNTGSGRDRSSWMSPVPELEGRAEMVLVGLWGSGVTRGWVSGVTSSPRVPSSTSSCWPGAEDGEEPAEQETSDSPGFGMTLGVCHPRLGCGGGEGTWAWSQRGGAEGRGCHQGQGWGGWVQPSITPVSPTGGWGRGRAGSLL